MSIRARTLVTAREVRAALEWYGRAAKRGDGAACLQLGMLCAKGEHVPQDYALAARWYSRGARLGNAAARDALAALNTVVESASPAKPDDFRALLVMARDGDADAQHRVGAAYLHGTGVTASLDEARRWLKSATAQAHPPSMALLAGLLLHHSVDAADVPLAVDLLRRAVACGSAEAQYNLGVCVRCGFGVARDDVEAERLYRAAAEQGHSSAQLALGSLVALRGAGQADAVEAARWYRLAADQGHPAAMKSLARCHEAGRGVPLDVGLALALYRKAVAAGHAAAEQDVKRLAEKLQIEANGALAAAG